MKKHTVLMIVLLSGLSFNLQAEDADYQAGKQIFEFRCVDTCHQTPNPASLNPKQWRIVLNTMQKRMATAGMAPLSEQELEQLLYYLTVEK